MKPLISIIIPLYNQSQALPNTLASIAKQSYPNLEVILVNDGSTDGIEKSIDRLKQVVNFKFFSQENRGAPTARNQGYKMSNGHYVVFWDADISAREDMLEKMQLALERNPNKSFVYSSFYFLGKKMKCGPFKAQRLKKQNYITTTSLIKSEDFPGFDQTLKRFQDWDLWLTMLENKKQGIWIDEYLFSVRTPGSISRWLPSYAYRFPFKWLPRWSKQVKEYNKAKLAVQKKHSSTA